MDVLDKLKNDWKKDGARYPKVSENEIYAMLHKRSSSIVKWILFISIIEFAILLSLSFFLGDHPNAEKMEVYMPKYLNISIYVVDNLINLTFIYLFYVNYKQIRNTDSVKQLMSKILKSRKTLTKYIYVKLAFIAILSFASFVFLFYNDPEWLSVLHEAQEKGDGTKASIFYFLIAIVGIALFVFIVWLVYKLIYGMLLKRLNRNYQELKKIEL